MIYPEVDPVKWSYTHDIPLIKERCKKCGKNVDVNIAIICKDFVGFESQDHGCGNQYIISITKPRDPNYMSKLFNEDGDE